MKTKEIIAKELGISRKTLYNYMNELNIKELTEENIEKIKEYLKNKNKSKEISKNELYEELEKLKKENSELKKQTEMYENSQQVLLNQIEWYRNSIDSDIRMIKENMTLLLSPPEEKKKKSFFNFFKK